MSGRILLDTNIVIALFANDTSVQQHLADSDDDFIPSMVLGELYFTSGTGLVRLVLHISLL